MFFGASRVLYVDIRKPHGSAQAAACCPADNFRSHGAQNSHQVASPHRKKHVTMQTCDLMGVLSSTGQIVDKQRPTWLQLLRGVVTCVTWTGSNTTGASCWHAEGSGRLFRVCNSCAAHFSVGNLQHCVFGNWAPSILHAYWGPSILHAYCFPYLLGSLQHGLLRFQRARLLTLVAVLSSSEAFTGITFWLPCLC